MIVIFADWAI